MFVGCEERFIFGTYPRQLLMRFLLLLNSDLVSLSCRHISLSLHFSLLSICIDFISNFQVVFNIHFYLFWAWKNVFLRGQAGSSINKLELETPIWENKNRKDRFWPHHGSSFICCPWCLLLSQTYAFVCVKWT